jgi:hypothetical protein
MAFSSTLLACCLVALLFDTAHAASYDLVKEYSGPKFFDDWTFYDHFDNLTNGDTVFLSASKAASSKLAYVDPTSSHAIIKVDNTSLIPYNYKRNSVRMTTKDRYAVGSVWIADMYHVPYGCSVWPAFWSQAPGWPKGGEIDTFEGVNMVTRNQMGLHTDDGCKVVNPIQSSTLINSTDCSVHANNNLGCITTNPSPQSYGEAFAAAGGGIFVTEFATPGISIWFFSRKDIPASLLPSANSSKIETSLLGTPIGNWPNGRSCDFDQYFAPQNLIFDIALCGDFAGASSVFSQTCPGVCYTDYVVGNGANYANAYFDIASVRVYGGKYSVVSGATHTRSSMLAIAPVLFALFWTL